MILAGDKRKVYTPQSSRKVKHLVLLLDYFYFYFFVCENPLELSQLFWKKTSVMQWICCRQADDVICQFTINPANPSLAVGISSSFSSSDLPGSIHSSIALLEKKLNKKHVISIHCKWIEQKFHLTSCFLLTISSFRDGRIRWDVCMELKLGSNSIILPG